jgi:hypothetical protein
VPLVTAGFVEEQLSPLTPTRPPDRTKVGSLACMAADSCKAGQGGSLPCPDARDRTSSEAGIGLDGRKTPRFFTKAK